jgi:hypothetical protein
MNILKIIEERQQYPLRNNKNSEMDYVFDRLSQKSEKVGLVLPVGFFQTHKDKDLRKLIFEEWHVVGVFDLGAIWGQWTSVCFNLLVLQKKKPEHVFFSQYLSKDTFVFNKKKVSKFEEIENHTPTKDFADYIKQIESLLNGGSMEKTDNYRLWKTSFADIDTEKLQSQFNDPELIENEKKLAQEKTDLLSNLADILKPRKLKDASEGLIVKTKDFKYPLCSDQLGTEVVTSVALKKGDIVFSDSFSGNQKFYLIHKDYKPKVYASSFLTVIRPKSAKITPEYLFLYLQSDVFKKYFLRYAAGVFFQRIRIKDLQELPVILPEKSTQEKSGRIFESLFLIPKENILEQINKELFDNSPVSEKPIQKEFVFEKLEDLRLWKREIIDSVLKDDFRELELAKKQAMYKSFVILAGSILEAFLMDWLCEKDGLDYFSSEEELALGSLIWKLFSFKEGRAPDNVLLKKADFIREKRNLVHPKKYFNSQWKLDEKTCNEILRDLRMIMKRR